MLLFPQHNCGCVCVCTCVCANTCVVCVCRCLLSLRLAAITTTTEREVVKIQHQQDGHGSIQSRRWVWRILIILFFILFFLSRNIQHLKRGFCKACYINVLVVPVPIPIWLHTSAPVTTRLYTQHYVSLHLTLVHGLAWCPCSWLLKIEPLETITNNQGSLEIPQTIWDREKADLKPARKLVTNLHFLQVAW